MVVLGQTVAPGQVAARRFTAVGVVGVAVVSFTGGAVGMFTVTHGLAREFFGTIAAVIAVAGYVPYLWGTIRRRVRPHAVSWLIWGLLGVVSLGGQITGHAGPALFVTAATTTGCLVVAITAVIFAGEVHADWWDYTILAAAVVGLLLLVVSPDPVWAVVWSNTVGTIAFIPTIRRALRTPSSEAVSVYAIAAVKFALALVTVEHVAVVTVLYPALCLVQELAMIILLLALHHRFVSPGPPSTTPAPNSIEGQD